MYTFIPTVLVLITSILKLNFPISIYWITQLYTLIPEEGAQIIDLIKVIGLTILYLILLFELSNFIIKRKEVK